MTQPRYSPEHRRQAERESLPLVTFDIDKRHLKSLPAAQRTRTTMQGCLGDEEAEDILNRVEPFTAKRAMPGLNAIVLERFRQVHKFSVEHDVETYPNKQLQDGVAYIILGPSSCSDLQPPQCVIDLCEKHAGDDIKLLAIAGALIAAEIDRLERKRIMDQASASEEPKA